MSRPATPINLTPNERAELERLVRLPKTQRRHSDRARIILKAADGLSNLQIAQVIETRPATVSKWRVRFEREGIEGLRDDFRPGRPPEGGDPATFRLDC